MMVRIAFQYFSFPRVLPSSLACLNQWQFWAHNSFSFHCLQLIPMSFLHRFHSQPLSSLFSIVFWVALPPSNFSFHSKSYMPFLFRLCLFAPNSILSVELPNKKTKSDQISTSQWSIQSFSYFFHCFQQSEAESSLALPVLKWQVPLMGQCMLKSMEGQCR